MQASYMWARSGKVQRPAGNMRPPPRLQDCRREGKRASRYYSKSRGYPIRAPRSAHFDRGSRPSIAPCMTACRLRLGPSTAQQCLCNHGSGHSPFWGGMCHRSGRPKDRELSSYHWGRWMGGSPRTVSGVVALLETRSSNRPMGAALCYKTPVQMYHSQTTAGCQRSARVRIRRWPLR